LILERDGSEELILERAAETTMPTTIQTLELFAKYGLQVSFLVGLIVLGLCTALTVVWRQARRREKELEKRIADVQTKLENTYEARLKDERERSEAVAAVSEETASALQEMVGAIDGLKQVALRRERG
jgi:hypothetical protein